MKYEIPEFNELNIEVRNGEAHITINGKQIVLAEGEKLNVEHISVSDNKQPEPAENPLKAGDEYELYADSELKRKRESCGEYDDNTASSANSTEIECEAEKQAYIPSKDGASFSKDFREAFKISVTNFRGSEKLIKSLKNVWYDKELQAGIHRVDGTGLTFLIAIIGAAITLLIGSQHFSTTVTAVLTVLWLLIDMLLINPILMYISVPKPVAPHIKQIDLMSPEEREIYEKDIAENKMVKRMLRRYDEKGQFIYKEKKKPWKES